MSQTLRRELRLKFEEVLVRNDVTSLTGIRSDFWQIVVNELADAALEVAGISKPKFRDVTWDLQHGEMPSEEGLSAARAEVKYKDIADRLSAGLRRGEFPQTTQAQTVYRWIAEREERGQSLNTFITWAMDGRRAEFSFIYHKDPALIKRDWLQVFPSDTVVIATPDKDGGFR